MPKRNTTDGYFLTIRGAARRSGLSEKAIRRAARAGEIPVHQIPGSRWARVCWEDVVAWARSKRVPASDHAERRVAEVLEREARRGRAEP